MTSDFKILLAGAVGFLALLGTPVVARASPYIVTLEEVGSNVVATGSGQIDLTGLSFFASFSGGVGNIEPSFGSAGVGVGNLDVYTGAPSTPASFGSGGLTEPSNTSGGLVEYDASAGTLAVPEGYVSNALLSASTSTYDSATFATLGATPGTYVWTWGTGADQSFTLEIGATPLPATLPLFATGFGALGLLGWRRKRKAQTVVA
jgi:hypothetical protein